MKSNILFENRKRKVFEILEHLPHFNFSSGHAGYFMFMRLPNFYPFNLQHSSCNHIFTIRVENSVDPDQMAWLKIN